MLFRSIASIISKFDPFFDVDTAESVARLIADILETSAASAEPHYYADEILSTTTSFNEAIDRGIPSEFSALRSVLRIDKTSLVKQLIGAKSALLKLYPEETHYEKNKLIQRFNPDAHASIACIIAENIMKAVDGPAPPIETSEIISDKIALANEVSRDSAENMALIRSAFRDNVNYFKDRLLDAKSTLLQLFPSDQFEDIHDIINAFDPSHQSEFAEAVARSCIDKLK